jgi:hypothetical protein
MSSSMREEMVDQFFEDLDTTKKYMLTAMDELVEKENISVRSMLFATLIVALHSNKAMSDSLYEGEDGYENAVKMAKSFVELADKAPAGQEEAVH